jgi:DNA-binding NtrC family response regulator
LSFKILCIGDIPESVAPHLLGDVFITCARGAFEALGLLRCEAFDLVLASVPVPGCSTPETLLDEIQQVSRSVRVILSDPSMDVERAMGLARRGAFDIVDDERLNRVLATSIASAQANLPVEDSAREPWRDLLIGNSARMQIFAELFLLFENRCFSVLSKVFICY